MVMLQSLLLHSPLRILGTHAHMPSVSFKPPGLGRELRSTTWESSNIAITLTADSHGGDFLLSVSLSLCLSGECTHPIAKTSPKKEEKKEFRMSVKLMNIYHYTLVTNYLSL